MFDMLDFIKAIPFSFAALFPVLNPFGCAVIFLTLTMGASQQELTRLSRKIALNTAILLIVVLFVGSWVLRFFGITIPIVQVGGGIVITYFGWSLLNQPPTKKVVVAEQEPPSSDGKDIRAMAFFPLTMPITAGPGCIAVTLTIGAHEARPTFMLELLSQAGAVVGILLAATVVFLCYNYASFVTRKLSESGLEVVMRLSAFINMCIGLEIIWHGIQALLLVPKA